MTDSKVGAARKLLASGTPPQDVIAIGEIRLAE
jgi:hypothetical protein